MRALAVLLLLALGACAAGPRLSRAALVGTTWREVCPAPEIVTAYIRLDADGQLAWSYEHPDAVVRDTVHAWAVEDGALVLRWTHGGATSRYPAGANADHLVADSSTFCLGEPPWLDRVR